MTGIAGQLDEELALYAISFVENKLADTYASAFPTVHKGNVVYSAPQSVWDQAWNATPAPKKKAGR